MADAEDLKSSGDFSSCGFDSHPGHQCFSLKLDDLQDRRLRCTSPWESTSGSRLQARAKSASNCSCRDLRGLAAHSGSLCNDDYASL